MNSESTMLRELVNKLRPLIEGKIRDAALLVWPNNEGRFRLISDLFLSVETKTGHVINVVISTQPDGQTPAVSEDIPSIEYNYDAFDGMFSEWNKQKRIEVTPDYHQIGFRLLDSSKYGWLKNETIKDVEIIVYHDDHAPTGIKIDFSSNHSMYSVAGVSGNIVFDSDEFPNDYFAAPVELISVSRE